MNANTYPRVSMTEKTPPPQIKVDMSPSPRVPVIEIPSTMVHNDTLNPITSSDRDIYDKD